MRILISFILIAVLSGCAKPKTVFICGDHVCLNKKEAEIYFEENLTIEVKIIDNKEKKRLDLVQLNLKENNTNKQEVKIFSKKKTTNDLKILSKKEKREIKQKIKNKKKNKKITKKINQKKFNKKTNKIKKNKRILDINNNNKEKSSKIINKNIDVCTILNKCNINEIAKYLIKESRNKDFPNINERQ